MKICWDNLEKLKYNKKKGWTVRWGKNFVRRRVYFRPTTNLLRKSQKNKSTMES